MDRDSCGRTGEQWTTLAAQRWPILARWPEAFEWLRVQADLGLAARTLEAYARGLADYLAVCAHEGIDPVTARRAEIARYVRDLTRRPNPRGARSSRSTPGSVSPMPRSSNAWWWYGCSTTT
jgi:integrase/recombinase XerD